MFQKQNKVVVPLVDGTRQRVPASSIVHPDPALADVEQGDPYQTVPLEPGQHLETIVNTPPVYAMALIDHIPEESESLTVAAEVPELSPAQ